MREITHDGPVERCHQEGRDSRHATEHTAHAASSWFLSARVVAAGAGGAGRAVDAHQRPALVLALTAQTVSPSRRQTTIPSVSSLP